MSSETPKSDPTYRKYLLARFPLSDFNAAAAWGDSDPTESGVALAVGAADRLAHKLRGIRSLQQLAAEVLADPSHVDLYRAYLKGRLDWDRLEPDADLPLVTAHALGLWHLQIERDDLPTAANVAEEVRRLTESAG